jgi:hypothetical protein
MGQRTSMKTIMNKPVHMTPEQAEAANLRSLTTPQPDDMGFIRRVCADLARGGISHAVVKTKYGFEVWRDSFGFKNAHDARNDIPPRIQ